MDTILFFDHRSTDPAFNLALEEFLLLRRRDAEETVVLWQNEPTVVLGRHQNTPDEIDPDVVARHGIHVVRRNSGGGAVYHDLGNLNYSILTHDADRDIDFVRFAEPLTRTLQNLGIDARCAGRNDVLIDGRKCSGSARFKHRDRLLFHGTVLFDSDLGRLAEVLRAPTKRNPASRAVPSVRSRVTNIVDHLTEKIDLDEFRQRLGREIGRDRNIRIGRLSESERADIEELAANKYRSRDWNYGAPPSRRTRNATRRFDWGTVEIRLALENERVRDGRFFGDFFCEENPESLVRAFLGLRFERPEFETRLDEAAVRAVFPRLTKEELLDLIFSLAR